MEKLVLNHVSKVYIVKKSDNKWGLKAHKENILAVNNFSLEIKKGEIVGVVGVNGAGKSTLIKMMTGVLQPTKGTVMLDGLNPVKNRKKYVKQIGCVFGQRSQLWWDLPAIDSFEMFKNIYHVPEGQYEEFFGDITNIISLDKLLKKPVRQMSLGQRMRCEIAAAFLHNPSLVFLDEPTIGLDFFVKEDIRKLIKYLNEKYCTTIVLSSHDMGDIEELCNRVILIDQGNIVYDGSLINLKKVMPEEKVIKLWLSSPINMRFQNVEIHEQNGRQLTLKINEEKVEIINLLEQISREADILDMEIRGMDIADLIKKYLLRGTTNE